MGEQGAFARFAEAYGKDRRKARKAAAALTGIWVILLLPVLAGLHGIPLQLLIGYSVVAFLPWGWFMAKAI